MQLHHHGTRIDNGASDPAPDRAAVQFADLDYARWQLLYDISARNGPAVLANDCRTFLAVYERTIPAACDGWHAADERAYTHDRATHLGHRPG